MAEKIKVSVLIPTYNRSHYLADAIESVLAQDYDNYELIVSDNASTDQTREVASKYLEHKKYRYIRNEKNVGLFNNWIKLIYEHASGEYGIVLPDDDYFINKSHISQAVGLIDKHKVNYIITDGIFEDEVRGITKKVNLNIPEFLSVEWALDNIGRRFADNIPFSPGLPSVFNIAKAKELKVLYPQVCGSDGEMGFRFMLDGPSAYMKGAQRFARGHKTSAGNTDSVDNTLNSMYIFDRMIEFGKSRGYSLRKLLRFKRRNAVLWMVNIIIPVWFGAYGASYLKFCAKLFLLKNRFSIDYKSYFRIITSRQVIARFLFEKNKWFYRNIRNLYWILKYRKKYPQEYETTK